MSNHPSRQPLIRISKNGEMRLKNKVGVAILKENAYEERALGTQLLALKKHKARQDKYMTYRQLEFASKQISASEERPHTIASTEMRSNTGLPPIQAMNGRRRSTTQLSGVDLEKSQDFSDPNRKTQGNWEKAVMMVRMAIQNRKNDQQHCKTFITQQLREQGEFAKESKSGEDTTLPPLSNSRDDRPSRSKKGKVFSRSRRLTLPEMIKISREKSMMGIQDPRFLKLESCLGGDGARSTRDRFSTARLTLDTETSTDTYRKRKLKTS